MAACIPTPFAAPMISKLLICPYFGAFPIWMPRFLNNANRLRAHGYDLLIDTDEDAFRQRVRSVLDIECPPMNGSGKVWDYRPALGALYAAEAANYEFWGHIDFDVVLGRVERFVTDAFLDGIDMHSNHDDYVNGCWSLYRNNSTMNWLFSDYPTWQWTLECPDPTGWIEKEYSLLMDLSAQEGELRLAWTEWQVFTVEDLAEVHWDGDRLVSHGEEVMMAHFRRTKVYPPGCIR